MFLDNETYLGKDSLLLKLLQLWNSLLHVEACLIGRHDCCILRGMCRYEAEYTSSPDFDGGLEIDGLIAGGEPELFCRTLLMVRVRLAAGVTRALSSPSADRTRLTPEAAGLACHKQAEAW